MAGIVDQFSRRSMLVGIGGAAAVGAAAVQSTGTSSIAQALGVAGAGGLKSAGYAAWSAQVGSTFKASTGHVLKLVDVHKVASKGARPSALRADSFIASFDVVRGGALADNLYRIGHPEGGAFDVFLTTGGRSTASRMLAVFN